MAKTKKGAYLHMRIDATLKNDAEKLAQDRNTTLSQLVTDLLTKEVKTAAA